MFSNEDRVKRGGLHKESYEGSESGRIGACI